MLALTPHRFSCATIVWPIVAFLWYIEVRTARAETLLLWTQMFHRLQFSHSRNITTKTLLLATVTYPYYNLFFVTSRLE